MNSLKMYVGHSQFNQFLGEKSNNTFLGVFSEYLFVISSQSSKNIVKYNISLLSKKEENGRERIDVILSK